MNRILMIVMWATLTSVGMAWGAVTAYTMVMNKDKKLCPAMFNLMNEDLKQYGVLRYYSQEFTAIKWERLGSLWGPRFEDAICSRTRMARFDMDNDGRTDIVIKHSGCFKSVSMDSIFLFDEEDPAFASVRDYEDLWAKSKGRFPLENETLSYYIIKELPRIKLPSGAMVDQVVGGWLVLDPFLYQGTFYLAVTDQDGEGFVIGKYKGPGELDDICYFSSEKEKISRRRLQKNDRGEGDARD